MVSATRPADLLPCVRGADRVSSKDHQKFPAGSWFDAASSSQAIDIENVFRLGGAAKRFLSLSFP